MTTNPIQEATAGLRVALDSCDSETIRLALQAAYPALVSYSPRDANAEQRELDRLAGLAEAFNAKRCEPGAHLDDCSCATKGTLR